ncbi:uncharacterized protein RSE6_01546 [Rhynchosporium secalis]|uniref:Uncharacterized protein n=1 Tax=Rhynchosporium secalis TaxID=38038 RepID=A0A1E1LY22_RHYSE|nr:uncharacterized protein RSE6_01546 [Rhynchosporium secalis]
MKKPNKTPLRPAPHTHATGTQSIFLSPSLSPPHSKYHVPSDEAPTSYIRANSPASTPMGPALAGIQLLALSYTESDKDGVQAKEGGKGRALLALAEAIVKVEEEIEWDEEMRESDKDEDRVEDVSEKHDVRGRSKESMCSKIPFVEMLVEQARIVDRQSLRVWLAYVKDVVREFGGALEKLEMDRDGERSGNMQRWKEPKVRK